MFFGFPTHIFTLFTVMKYESKGQKNTGLPKSFTMLLRMKLETFLLDNRVIVLRNFCNLSLSLGQSSNFLFQSLKCLKILLKNTTEFTDETGSTISHVYSVVVWHLNSIGCFIYRNILRKYRPAVYLPLFKLQLLKKIDKLIGYSHLVLKKAVEGLGTL